MFCSVADDANVNDFSLLAETHGTCAYPEIQDEYDYFSTALYLYSKYNVTVSHLLSSHLSTKNLGLIGTAPHFSIKERLQTAPRTKPFGRARKELLSSTKRSLMHDL